MKRNTKLILIVFIFVFVGGCAAKAKISPERTVEFEKDRLVQAYLQTGEEYENKGNLVEAWKHYSLALTVNPESQVASEKANRLKGELRKLADQHYQAGLRYQRKGQYRAARREFLMTVGLWPDHEEAVKILSGGKRIRAKRYVVHTIKQGESLSQLAKMYYGDYKKFPMIANYNGLPDATVIRLGQKIKVPEIEGVPFFVASQKVSVEKVEAYPIDDGFEEEAKEELEEDESLGRVEESVEEPVDVVAMYRDHGIGLFDKGEYQEAIEEFRKVVSVHSDDAIAIDYLSKSHFQLAMVSFAQRDYLSARDGFEESLRYKSDCKRCHEYVEKSEEQYKELHYAKGLSHFRDERLAEALKEWELVQAVDPAYEDVEENINKVKKLLKTLEGIQKSQEEPVH